MNFIDGSLFPENQEKLVITLRLRARVDAGRLPRGHPGHDRGARPEGRRLLQRRRHRAARTRARARRQGQQAPVEVQRADRRRARRRAGHDHPGRWSISFAPESEGAAAKWLSDDTRHMLAELDPPPDQVTIAINTKQMNIVEQMDVKDIAGTSLAEPDGFRAYSEHDRALDAELLRGARAAPQRRPASRAPSSSTTSTATRPSSA